jgi:sugar phosphate isomerase/epimerase
MNHAQPETFALGVSDFGATDPLINAQRIINSGMDFIEPGLAKIAALQHDDFATAAAGIKASQIRVQSVNWFLPPTLKVTGPDVDETMSRQFLELALGRAETLGAKAVVFGSPGSRSLPAGFSPQTGRQQMVAFCQLCSDIIRDHGWGMKIAVEHVNHTETNFLNTFAQSLAIVREVNRPQIGLAADFYHFAMASESTDIMLDAADLICAVQLANPADRRFPQPDDEIPGMEQFFRRLIDVGYQGGISVEATSGSDLEADCRGAAQFLRKLIRGIVS